MANEYVNVYGTDEAETLQGDQGPNFNVFDRMFGFGGDDKLYGLEGSDILLGGAGSDYLDGGNNGELTPDYAAYFDSPSGVFVSLITGDGVGGYANGDTLVNIEGLMGSAYDDFLVGNDGVNILKGDNGHDVLQGNGADDRLFGESGNDALDGGTGVDYLFGGTGDDDLYGGAGGDTDFLLGGQGDDFLQGGDGDDSLEGSNGDDVLQGGTGADELYGGELEPDGNTVDVDVATYSDSASGVFVSLMNGSGVGGTANGDTLQDIEGLIGSSFDDFLIGTDGFNTLRGGDGHDILQGFGGTDMLYGESGDDALDGGAGVDFLYGGTGDDDLAGGDNNDSLRGDENNDVLQGGAGQDELYGGADADDLNGGDGDDGLYGGDGNDTIHGGSGLDTVYGGDGNDRILAGADFAAGEVVDGGAGSDTIVLDGQYDGFVLTGAQLHDVEYVELTAGQGYNLSADNTLVASGVFMVINGSHLGRHDRLVFDGKGERDGFLSVTGGAGNDKLTLGNGGGYLQSSFGHDTLKAGHGADQFGLTVATSTGMGFDTIVGFDFSGTPLVTSDQFSVSAQVTGIDSTIAAGTLGRANFDIDLANAADAAHLAAGHAAIFTPDDGTYDGTTFLVIDQNGVAGYQSGGDIVVQLKAPHDIASIGTEDFYTFF